jgi:hypothetical protein
LIQRHFYPARKIKLGKVGGRQQELGPELQQQRNLWLYWPHQNAKLSSFCGEAILMKAGL